MGQQKKTAASPDGEAASSRPEGDIIDGDAKRAARLEGAERRLYRDFGRDWDLVAELPFAFAETARNDPVKALRAIFVNPEDADAYLENRPSDPDVAEMIRSYGTSQGK